MQCPDCSSTDISKNGRQRGKQNYLCKACRRQFIETYDPPSGYSEAFKQECLKLYLNGMGFRAIERVKGVHHTTVILWVKQTGQLLPDAYEPDVTPEVGELDELETFVGSKKQTLDLDGGRPLQGRHSGVGDWRPQQRDVQALVGGCAGLEMLLLGDIIMQRRHFMQHGTLRLKQ